MDDESSRLAAHKNPVESTFHGLPELQSRQQSRHAERKEGHDDAMTSCETGRE